MHDWTFYGSTKNNGACPASAVIWWVLFASSASNPSLSSLAFHEEYHTSVWVSWQFAAGSEMTVLIYCKATDTCRLMQVGWCHNLFGFVRAQDVQTSNVRATLMSLSVEYVWFCMVLNMWRICNFCFSNLSSCRIQNNMVAMCTCAVCSFNFVRSNEPFC
jgi:hypothetical protein